MSKLRWMIFITATIGLLLALVIYSKNNDIDVSNIDTNAIQAASTDNGNIGDHVYGNIDSTVTLINYGDFQCPGCGTTHKIIKPIVEQYRDQIRFVFRNFPLFSIHPNAKAAAGSAEAAGLQGKFWEMHDMIYETQDSWSSLSSTERTNLFTKYAKDLGLDIKQFTADLNSNDITKKIAFDFALGQKAKVAATPTFFLNGNQLDLEKLSENDDPASNIKAAIDIELKKAGIAPPNTN